MSENSNNDQKNKVLSLKVGSNTVRQSFSHGRSKSVVVETKRKRIITPHTNTKKPSIKIDEINTTDKFKSNLSSLEVDRRKKALEAAKVEEIKRLKEKKIKQEDNKIEQKVSEEKNKKDTIKSKNNYVLDLKINDPVTPEIPLKEPQNIKNRIKQEDTNKKNLDEEIRQIKPSKNMEDRRQEY